MKILVLRVGIDTGCGKSLGPIFPDNTFEYIPIPEGAQTDPYRTIFYRDIRCRNSKHTLNHYVHKKYSYWPTHLDPEFETQTYGDPTKNKRGQLLRLNQGDMLLFYAGLRPPEQKHGSIVYLIGYFTVNSVYHNKDTVLGNKWPPDDARFLHRNAHFIRKYPEPGLVVVQGTMERSALLKKAVQLSDANHYVLPHIHSSMGLKGSLRRAIGRWVPDGKVNQVQRWCYGLD